MRALNFTRFDRLGASADEIALRAMEAGRLSQPTKRELRDRLAQAVRNTAALQRRRTNRTGKR